MEIVVLENGRMDPATLAFGVRAVNHQLEQLATAYDEEPWVARSYATLPTSGEFAVMLLLDEIDEPGALGYHALEDSGKPYGRCKIAKDSNDFTTASHECCEMAMDPDINLWLPLPDGRRLAREVCDPCQNDEYPMRVTIGSETRVIAVSDFVTPSYFVAGSMGPYSFRDNVPEPFGVSRNGGGWRLVRDAAGKITSEYGPLGASSGLVKAMSKRAADPGSRTYRRGFRSHA